MLYLNQKKKRKCPFVNAIVSLVFPLPLSTSIGLLSMLSPKKKKKVIIYLGQRKCNEDHIGLD